MTLTASAFSLGLAGLAIGSAALATKRQVVRREAAAEAAYPPAGLLLKANGLTVHAEVAGSGPDLVLIHGANGCTRDFTFALMDRLRDRYRVVALDRPGLGWSQDAGAAGVSPLVQADILRRACTELGVTRPIVLGQSYGGSVAMAWALRDPATAALVIVAGATMPWPGKLGLTYRLTAHPLAAAALMPLASAWIPDAQIDRTLTAIFAPDPVPPGYADHVGTALALRRGSLVANARQVNGLKPNVQAMAQDYPRLMLPVEIVHGTADTIVPARVHALPLAQCLPEARLTLIEGAGHMPHHTHPEAVIAAIDRARLRTGL
jgi:pimeloyl-ACP methyl ester carboxylesterase